MSDFWKSYDITAAEYGACYECYPLFGTVHLIELALSALFLLCMVWWYRRSTPRTRRHILVGVTAALLADEAALLLGMGLDGRDEHRRITRGDNFCLVGGSEETHEKMTETAVKFNEKLSKRGKRLGELSREEFTDLIREASGK